MGAAGKLVRGLLPALLVAVVGPGALAAQQRLPSLVPIAPTHPAAQRAGGLVTLLLSGEHEKAAAYANEHIARENARVVGEGIHALLPALMGRGFQVRDYVRG